MKQAKLFCRAISLLAAAMLILAACQSLTTTKVGSIVNDPRKFEGKTVTVAGEVTERLDVVAVKYFKLRDGTGEIHIITKRALPELGSKLKVTGQVDEFSFLGWQGVVIREAGIGRQ